MPMSPLIKQTLENILDDLGDLNDKEIQIDKSATFIAIDNLLQSDSNDSEVFHFFADHPEIVSTLEFIDIGQTRRFMALLSSHNVAQEVKLTSSTQGIKDVLEQAQQKERKLSGPPSQEPAKLSTTQHPQTDDINLATQLSLGGVAVREKKRTVTSETKDPANIADVSRSEVAENQSPAQFVLTGLVKKEKKANDSTESKSLPFANYVLPAITEDQVKIAEVKLTNELSTFQIIPELFYGDRLMRAVEEGDLPMISYLCNKKLELKNLRYSTNKDATPLTVAFGKQNVDVMILLFRLGYIVNPMDVRQLIYNYSWNSKIFTSAELKKIWGTKNITADGKNQRLFANLRFKEAYEGNVDILKSMVETDLEYGDNEVASRVLYYACAGGNLDVVEGICKLHTEYQVDAEHKNNRNESALSAAILHDHVPVVEYLVEQQNFSLTSVDSGNYTPLHRAVSFAMVKYLVKAISENDPKTRNPRAPHIIRAQAAMGLTVLMTVCFNSYLENGEISKIIKLLNKEDRRLYGSNEGYVPLVDMRDSDGNTLICRIIKGNYPLLTESQRQEALTALIKCGANPNIGIPLIAAVQDSDLKLTQFLLEQGADVNLRQHNNRQTALMCAKEPKIAKLLIQKGADVAMRDSVGCTAMHYVHNQNFFIATQLVDILSQHGGDVNDKTTVGIPVTPLEKTIQLGARRSQASTLSKISALLKHDTIVTESTLQIASEQSGNKNYDPMVFILVFQAFFNSGQKITGELSTKIKSTIKEKLHSPEREFAEGILASAQGMNEIADEKYAFVANHADKARVLLVTLGNIYVRKLRDAGLDIPSPEDGLTKQGEFKELKESKKTKTIRVSSAESNYQHIFQLYQYYLKCTDTKNYLNFLVKDVASIDHFIVADRLAADSLSADEQLQLAALKKVPQDDNRDSLSDLLKEKKEKSSTGVVADYLATVLPSNTPEVKNPAGAFAVNENKLSIEDQLQKAQRGLEALRQKEAICQDLMTMTAGQRKSLYETLTQMEQKNEKLTAYKTTQLTLLKEMDHADQLSVDKPGVLAVQLESVVLEKNKWQLELRILSGLMNVSLEKQHQLLTELQRKQQADYAARIAYLRPIQYQILRLIPLEAKLPSDDGLQLAKLIFDLKYDPNAVVPLTPEDFIKMGQATNREEKSETLKPYVKNAFSRADKAFIQCVIEGLKEDSLLMSEAVNFVNFLSEKICDMEDPKQHEEVKNLLEKNLLDLPEADREDYFSKLAERIQPDSPSLSALDEIRITLMHSFVEKDLSALNPEKRNVLFDTLFEKEKADDLTKVDVKKEGMLDESKGEKKKEDKSLFTEIEKFKFKLLKMLIQEELLKMKPEERKQLFEALVANEKENKLTALGYFNLEILKTQGGELKLELDAPVQQVHVSTQQKSSRRLSS